MSQRVRLGIVGAVALLLLVLIVITVNILHNLPGSNPNGRGASGTPATQSQELSSGFLNALPTAVAEQPTATSLPPTATPLPPTATPPPTATLPTATPRPRPTATPRPPAPTPIPPGGQPLPPAVGVTLHGTQLVDANGRAIRLIGVNQSHFEFECDTFHMDVGNFQNMRAWGMNAVRLPMSSELWNYCGGYQQALIASVSNAENAGMYVVLTLQWNAPFNTAQDRQTGGTQYPLPDNNQDVNFWRSLATLYKQDTRVLFDLMGEPHDVNFNQWFNGGSITVNACTCFPPYSTSGTYQAIGMKALAQIVRGIAPNNVIIASGIDYGYNLYGLGQGYAIPVSNIMYGTHPFDWPNKQAGNWGYSFGNYSGTYPIILTEFGEYDCGIHYDTQIVPYANSLNLSWLAWNWGTGDCRSPNLLANWNGTPQGSFGAYIQQQSLAIYHP